MILGSWISHRAFGPFKVVARYFVVAAVAVVLLLTATSCSESPSAASSESSDWRSWSLEVNGTPLTLPCTLSDFESTGLDVTVSSPMELEDGQFWLQWQAVKPGNDSGYIFGSTYCDTANPSKGQVIIDWCSINLTANNSEPFEVVLPGDISWGSSTIDRAIDAYGEPDESVSIDKEGITSYFWYVDPSVKDGAGYLNLGAYNDGGAIEHIGIGCPGNR